MENVYKKNFNFERLIITIKEKSKSEVQPMILIYEATE